MGNLALEGIRVSEKEKDSTLATFDFPTFIPGRLPDSSRAAHFVPLVVETLGGLNHNVLLEPLFIPEGEP